MSGVQDNTIQFFLSGLSLIHNNIIWFFGLFKPSLSNTNWQAIDHHPPHLQSLHFLRSVSRPNWLAIDLDFVNNLWLPNVFIYDLKEFKVNWSALLLFVFVVVLKCNWLLSITSDTDGPYGLRWRTFLLSFFNPSWYSSFSFFNPLWYSSSFSSTSIQLNY